jgi:hypothetical protein
LSRLGSPGGMNIRLARFVDASNLLCREEPRKVTFALRDEVEKTPSYMEHVFQALGEPFHKLNAHGFDVRVTYASAMKGSSRYFGHQDFKQWDLGSDGWKFQDSDVWKWTVYD